MQQHTDYEHLLNDVLYYFSEKISKAHAHGINDVIIDPGFGFSKTLAQNYELMQKLDLFKITEKPILVGISRKSMIYKLLKTDAKNALNGTSVLHTIALLKGAHILRVHDVKEAAECIEIVAQTELTNNSF
jgi:dihydropteroate synthase